MKPLVIAAHGWGFDAALWAQLLPLLPHCDVSTVDLGYFGEGWPLAPVGGRDLVLLGHSAGVMWLLRHVDPVRVRGLVAVNGFPRFVSCEVGYTGVAPRIVQRMMRRFREDPSEVLRDFYGRCGATAKIGDLATLDEGALLFGLQDLMKSDLRPQLAALDCPVLALASRDDAIVPAEMAAEAFADARDRRLIWHETGGHLLPLTAPAWCAAEIGTFLLDLSTRSR